MLRLWLVVFLTSILFFSPMKLMAAEPEYDSQFLDRYMWNLYSKNSDSGKHFKDSQRQAYLNEPLIKALIFEYKRSARKIVKRHLFENFVTAYEKHLVEFAEHAARAQLDDIVIMNFTQQIYDGTPREEIHMRTLGKIYDDMLDSSFTAYSLRRSDKVEYAALALYAETEAYVRLALLNMQRYSDREVAKKLLEIFWSEASTVNYDSFVFSLYPLEKFSEKKFAELVGVYQNILSQGYCTELLRNRAQVKKDYEDIYQK